MPQTLFLVVGGGVTEQAGDNIARVLALPGARVATDEEVVTHTGALDAYHAHVAATEAGAQAPTVTEATPAPADSVPEAPTPTEAQQ